MRVGLDATPLLGVRTGIGRYTADLLTALADGPDELVATAFTLRGRGGLDVPPGVQVRARPVPARLLQEAWARTPFPPVELLTGRLDVFHAHQLRAAAAARGRRRDRARPGVPAADVDGQRGERPLPRAGPPLGPPGVASS